MGKFFVKQHNKPGRINGFGAVFDPFLCIDVDDDHADPVPGIAAVQVAGKIHILVVKGDV